MLLFIIAATLMYIGFISRTHNTYLVNRVAYIKEAWRVATCKDISYNNHIWIQSLAVN